MESYTRGEARIVVDICWRKLADRGHPLQEQYVNEMRLRAYGPRVAAPAKDLEKAIAAWETDLRHFIDATGESFPEANRRLGLINMCPDRLRTHLRTGGRE